MARTVPFRLMDLLPELRLVVWDFVLEPHIKRRIILSIQDDIYNTSWRPIADSNVRESTTYQGPGLLATSKALYAETITLFYRHTHFYLNVEQNNYDLANPDFASKGRRVAQPIKPIQDCSFLQLAKKVSVRVSMCDDEEMQCRLSLLFLAMDYGKHIKSLDISLVGSRRRLSGTDEGTFLTDVLLSLDSVCDNARVCFQALEGDMERSGSLKDLRSTVDRYKRDGSAWATSEQ